MERREGRVAAADLVDVEAEAFTRFASKYIPQFDLVLAASDRELTSLGAPADRCAVIPNVVRAPLARPPRRSSCFTILFVGSLGYGPNADAVAWFVSRVWARLQRAMNFNVQLLIVGSHPPPAIRRLNGLRGIRVTGAVADVAPFYREADLAVAPIRAGGGTRIKIIEAAAHRLPIVATSLAREGTTFKPGIDMLVADNELSFFRACLTLANQRSTARRLADQAHARYKQHYSSLYWRKRVVQLIANDGASGSGTVAD
jgi:glycosyltransferase involved in cell wall biosynthesis